MDPYSLWEDDDTRVFYECLTDLKTKVPAVSGSCNIYHIRTNISKELNLANWQIFNRLPNLNLINIFLYRQ